MDPNVAGSNPVDRPSYLTYVQTMSPIEALILGIIQGLTEFLPISSSGHLVLGQYLLGFRNLKDLVDFSLVCHLGTLLAVCLVFREQLYHIFTSDRRKAILIGLGTLPLFPLAIIADPIKDIFDQVQFLGLFFWITAFLLFVSHSLGQTRERVNLRRDSCLIGLFQAFAIFPGISRSGSTIAGARLLGWQPQEAVTFSFLLSIPAILGGCVLEFGKLYLHHGEQASLTLQPSVYFVGFMSAFLVGWGALRLLIQLVQRDKLIYFAWYCLGLGCFTLYYFNAS